jgi:hypothetical protein
VATLLAGALREEEMFKLVVTVRRGTASSFGAAWTPYGTLEAARLGATALLRNERVQRVAIVRDEVPPAFVEWLER